MKPIYKVLVAAAAAMPLLTSCIEEAIPTSLVIASQVEGNANATKSLVWGMPGRMNQITISTDAHYDGGYSSIMHIRDVMTEDMAVDYAGGFDWFGSWSQNMYTNGDYLSTQFIWNYYYEQILTTNNVMRTITEDTDNEVLLSYLGTALAYRAFIYLDAARMYEVLPNEMFPDCMSSDGSHDIKGLTIPIVTEATTEEDCRNNPRVSHQVMFDFILDDLTRSAKLLSENTLSDASKMLPTLAVTYGLMARAYLWDASYQEEINDDAAKAAEQYGKAAEYARKAISEHGGTVTTQAEYLSTTNGFNDESVSSWMFAGKYSAEDDVVVAGGIRTWSSFNCNEQDFGYAAPAQGAWTNIGASVYNRMSDRDFRKLLYVAPDNSSLKGREPYLDPEWAAEYLTQPYISLKFRPGQGNMTDYNVGAVVAYPLMRVEEMYFIEAEAVAHTNAAAGNNLLKDFMTKYRYAAYRNNVASTEAVVEEIIFQKRVELWGEGQTFYDVKRLNYSVTRWYDGTNFDSSLNTFNTNGRPCWMNYNITRGESNNNRALVGYLTPSNDGLYTPNK